MTRLIIRCLRIYKRWISPRVGRTCIYRPTCSKYMELAVLKYGPAKGVRMGWERLKRCRAEYLPGGDDWP